MTDQFGKNSLRFLVNCSGVLHVEKGLGAIDADKMLETCGATPTRSLTDAQLPAQHVRASAYVQALCAAAALGQVQGQ